MPNEYRSVYKGHEIFVSLMRDIERGWTYAARIDKGVVMVPTRTFDTPAEALDAAVQSCEDRIENPFVRQSDELPSDAI
jgi:hypothetical protein